MAKEAVYAALIDIMRRRERFVYQAACRKEGLYGYTTQQWHEHLQTTPLGCGDMDDAVQQWKIKFHNSDFKNQEGVAKWMAENTRESRKKQGTGSTEHGKSN